MTANKSLFLLGSTILQGIIFRFEKKKPINYQF